MDIQLTGYVADNYIGLAADHSFTHDRNVHGQSVTVQSHPSIRFNCDLS